MALRLKAMVAPKKKKSTKGATVKLKTIVPKVPAVMGRPTKQTPEIVNELIDRLEKGQMLINICEDDKMPDRANVYKWMDNDPDFRDRIRSAREKGFDAIAEECLRIADMAALDTLISEKTGNPMLDTEWVQRSKLRVDTRLRLLAKWSPKRFGDKIEVENTGLTPVVNITIGGDVN